MTHEDVGDEAVGQDQSLDRFAMGTADSSVDLVGSTGLTAGLVPFSSAIDVNLAAITFLVTS